MPRGAAGELDRRRTGLAHAPAGPDPTIRLDLIRTHTARARPRIERQTAGIALDRLAPLATSSAPARARSTACRLDADRPPRQVDAGSAASWTGTPGRSLSFRPRPRRRPSPRCWSAASDPALPWAWSRREAGHRAGFRLGLPENGLACHRFAVRPARVDRFQPRDAVRLSRACRLRRRRRAICGVFRVLAATARAELDNVVVLPIVRILGRSAAPAPGRWLAAARPCESRGSDSGSRRTRGDRERRCATLDNRDLSTRRSCNWSGEERSRLYRFLRRLSFLEPLPSWGPFITARVTIVAAPDLIDGLAKQGIRVHAPARTRTGELCPDRHRIPDGHGSPASGAPGIGA